MSSESVETKVVRLSSDLNTTFTTFFPFYMAINTSVNMNASDPPPPPNMCQWKPPLETWEEDLGFFLNGVITILVIALGLVGNMLTVIVLLNRTMKTSTNCFLLALAIWDSIVLLVTFFLICIPEFTDEYLHTVFPYIVAFIYPLGLVAQTITIWLTVSFTVERYIAVCHPLRAAVMCTIPRARMVITGVCGISLLYNLPRWFEYRVMPFTHPPTNETCQIIAPTKFSMDPMYNKIYFGWSYFLVMCVIPLLSLFVLNTFLILAVRASKAQRRDMNVRQSRENNVTIMLIAVVLLFMLFQVPALIYNMAYAIDMATTKSSFGWKVLSSIRNFLVNVNSAVNFILYCALGQKFRRTFVRTFCPQLRKTVDNFHSFSNHNHYKMEKINKSNGTTKYVKMAAKNHATSTTGDSGVIKSAAVSRYSSPVSVSKMSVKYKETHNTTFDRQESLDGDNSGKCEGHVKPENGKDTDKSDAPLVNGSHNTTEKTNTSLDKDKSKHDTTSANGSNNNDKTNTIDKDTKADSNANTDITPNIQNIEKTKNSDIDTSDGPKKQEKSHTEDLDKNSNKSDTPNGKSQSNVSPKDENVPNIQNIPNNHRPVECTEDPNDSKTPLLLFLDTLPESEIL